MTISKSNVSPLIIERIETRLGMLYFLEHIAIIEFNEGIHVDFKSFGETIEDIKSFYGNTKPFGLIANRVNSYSIELIDSSLVKSNLINMVAYGVVSHNEAGRMNAEIENSFCTTHNISFDNLYEALDAISHRVNKSEVELIN